MKSKSEAVIALTFVIVCWNTVVGFTGGVQEKQGKDAHDANAPRVVVRLEHGDDAVIQFLGFSPNNKILAYSLSRFGSKDLPTLIFYDLEKLKEIKRVSGPDPFIAVRSAIFLPDNGKLIVAYQRSYVLDWKQGRIGPSFEPMISLRLVPRGDSLVGIGNRQMLGGGWGPQEFYVWDVTTGEKLRYFGGQEHRNIREYCISDDGRLLVAEHRRWLKSEEKRLINYYRSSVRVWDITSGKEVGLVGKVQESRWENDQEQVYQRGTTFHEAGCVGPNCRVRISPGGKIAVFPNWPRHMLLQVVKEQRALSLRELATGKEFKKFTDFDHPREVSLSPDEHHLAGSGQLVVGRAKSALVVWDVSTALAKARRPREALAQKKLVWLWEKCAEKDPIAAYQAMRQLAAAPEQSLPFLTRQLKPAPDRSKEIAGLISKLKESHEVEQKAQEGLVAIGDDAVSALEKALQAAFSKEARTPIARTLQAIKAANQPDPQTKQLLWGIETLEFLGTAEARALLEHLAKGAPDAWLTLEAKKSLQRLGKTPNNTN